MKVLVIGSGGREHALVWKLAQSKKVEKIYAAPGNGGTAGEEKTENFPVTNPPGSSVNPKNTPADPKNPPIDPSSEEGQKALVEFAKKENIDLTVVGPEAPLAAGIVDTFRAAGLAIVGPGQKAARLESSKVYSKSFMAQYGVRAAASENFTNLAAALEYTEKHFGASPAALVIKADGLAAGKGVVIAADLAEARQALEAFMKEGVLGEAGKNVIIEEYLDGVEVSVLAAVSVVPDGSPGNKKGVIKPFLSARDHKSRFEGGRGPNTGGMGAIAPVPDFTPALRKDFENAILLPTLKGMEEEKMDYRGFLFFGLMVKDGQCYVLEYNARLGDPETQVLLPLMDCDFAALCVSILDQSLDSFDIKWKKLAACAPVLVPRGYPGPYKKDLPVAMNKIMLGRLGAKVFIANAQRGTGGASGSGLRTSGGRVLSVCTFGADTAQACGRAYEALNYIRFDDMDFRKDIRPEGSSG